MNDELTKKLKDAGFPLKYVNDPRQIANIQFKDGSFALYPTLSELIEACGGDKGQRFRWLKNMKTHWVAQARPKHPINEKDPKAMGKTPEEAVANLWLQLNQSKITS